jgi:hypothetical protein
MKLLKQNSYMIDWWNLSCNSNADAVELLKKNPDKIVWFSLSFYEHGSGGTAETQPDKIDWYNLSINPSIFEIDYEALKNRTAFKEELVMVGSSPK